MRKPKEKILCSFWWPDLEKDIRNVFKSCDVCQTTVAKGRVSSLPLSKMSIIDTQELQLIHPPSDDGHRFILTLVG